MLLRVCACCCAFVAWCCAQNLGHQTQGTHFNTVATPRVSTLINDCFLMALKPQYVAPELLTKVTKALGITAVDQWYYVTQQAATKAIGSRVLNEFGGSVASFLKSAYPQHHFDEEKLTSKRGQEKAQKFIEVVIRQLFPNTEILTKARKAIGIKNPETGAYLEIDFWIPSLKLGIEYQDKHHFEYQWFANDTLENYQKRDDFKKDAMAALGYTLISIGYWWDKTLESVAATIRRFRPDLLHKYESVSVEPIPSEPPGSINAAPVIPGIVGLMSPFIPNTDFDPTNWYAGEKHDGIRGVYNAKLRKMFSRSGNELSILPLLLNDIPSMLVEGEITAGHGNYNKTAAISYHTYHDKVNWPMFRYVVFDIPNAELGNYSQRYSEITRGLQAHPFIFAQPAFRVLLHNKAHLKMLIEAIINDSGEGVIAQQDARYEYGRARGLAKIKVRRDADAQVLSINEDSCTCKLISGVIADINLSNDFNPNNLLTGDIISYYHDGYAQNGFPKRAEIYKVRYDVTWKQLLGEDASAANRRSVKEALGSKSLIESNIGRNKMGHWNKPANVRAYFDNFAKTSGFDPLVPGNWYQVRIGALQKAGGGGLHRAFSNNIKKALSCAYPELNFEKGEFITYQYPRSKGHWHKIQNVRQFLVEFAQTYGFDPLVPENWKTVRYSTLENAGGSGLLKAYDCNIQKAVASAFPELSFGEDKPRTQAKKGHWNSTANVRAFFDEFARSSGFDPLLPENWYLVTGVSLRNAGGAGVLNAHDYSFKSALSSAYPELKFGQEESFVFHQQKKVKNGHWNEPANVRAYFDEFARTTGFDPHIPQNWTSVKHSTLQIAKGSGLLGVYDYDLKKALSCAYPELHFK